MTPNAFVQHPQLDGLQMSFKYAGYSTLGAGKLFHQPEGAIDERGWWMFFHRNQIQRQSGAVSGMGSHPEQQRRTNSGHDSSQLGRRTDVASARQAVLSGMRTLFPPFFELLSSKVLRHVRSGLNCKASLQRRRFGGPAVKHFGSRNVDIHNPVFDSDHE